MLAADPLPPAWTGKLRAVARGLRRQALTLKPDYLLLTGADILQVLSLPALMRNHLWGTVIRPGRYAAKFLNQLAQR